MVVGSSCSESGSSLLEEVGVEEGGCRGMRLYFVLLGRASLSISWRKDCSSRSATWSLVSDFEESGDAAVVDSGMEFGVDEALSWGGGGGDDEKDQGQAIVDLLECRGVLVMARLKVLRSSPYI
jgi:hypothetical protein